MVRLSAPEFTTMCPITGQPDFATIVVDYVPADLLVESKSFKLFLGSFRNHGAFHEDCTVYIHNRLKEAMSPRVHPGDRYLECKGRNRHRCRGGKRHFASILYSFAPGKDGLPGRKGVEFTPDQVRGEWISIMKLSFSTNAFVRFSVPEAIEIIAKTGYSGVEILADVPHLYPFSTTAPRTCRNCLLVWKKTGSGRPT